MGEMEEATEDGGVDGGEKGVGEMEVGKEEEEMVEEMAVVGMVEEMAVVGMVEEGVGRWRWGGGGDGGGDGG